MPLKLEGERLCWYCAQADEQLLKLEVGELPGVGWSMCDKLKGLGITTVADVRNTRRDVLQREMGAKTGLLVRALARAKVLEFWLCRIHCSMRWSRKQACWCVFWLRVCLLVSQHLLYLSSPCAGEPSRRC